MPQVSVIVPTYNRAPHILEAVESVLRQTFADYELIVVDDGSTDSTKEALQPYLGKISYIYQSNKGVSAARNRGIREAKGEWIAFLDSDDIWMPEKLEKQLMVAAKTDVIYLHIAVWFVDNEQDAALLEKCASISWPTTDSEGMILDPVLSIARAEPYMMPALLCHRSCFDRIGFFEETLTAGEDEDWLSRASLACKFHLLREPLAKVRYHQNQTGLSSEKSVRSLVVVMDRMYQRTRGVYPAASRVARKRYASKLSHLANILAKQGEKQDATAYALKAFCVEPAKISRLVKVCMIIAGFPLKQFK